MSVRTDHHNTVGRVEEAHNIILPHGVFVARSEDLQMGVSKVGTTLGLKLIHREIALLVGDTEKRLHSLPLFSFIFSFFFLPVFGGAAEVHVSSNSSSSVLMALGLQ